MLRSAKKIAGFAIQATDGEIGKVSEFLFDDKDWTIRYLVADTGKWMEKKLVLVSPCKLSAVSWDEKSMPVAMTRAEVRASPDITRDRPVHLQIEEPYDTSMAAEAQPVDRVGSYPAIWTTGLGPMLVVPQMDAGTGHRAETTSRAEIPILSGPDVGWRSEADELAATPEGGAGPLASRRGDPHLRSTKEVSGYHIQARDGEIGHVEDFLVDDADWVIRYLVVDTRNFWPGKKVLVSPGWISRIDWGTQLVHADLDREAIKSGPEYKPDQLLDRAYESRLHRHHTRTFYWETPESREQQGTGADHVSPRIQSEKGKRVRDSEKSLRRRGSLQGPNDPGRGPDSQQATKRSRRNP